MLPADKLDDRSFLLPSAVSWEWESVATLNTLQIYLHSRVSTNTYHCVFKIVIRNAVWYSWYFHVVSAATLLLLLLIFFKILSSYLRLTSPTLSISLWSFLLSATIWFMLSVSLSIFLQSSCRSASMTTFPLRSRIFWTNPDFFNEFNADFDKFKIFLLLSPVLNNPLKCARREMKILKFSW